MLIARPAAVFLCLAPFNFQWREKLFISWVGLRGAVGIFLASIPLLVGLPAAYLYFDVAFVVVLSSLLIQGWTVALAARKLDMSFARSDPLPRRVELDLPGQLDARDRRLSGAGQQPVPAPRPDPELGAADAGRAQRADPHAGGSQAGARGRLRLSAGAAGEGAGARPLLRRHAAAGCARSARCSATSSCRATATLGALAEIYGLQVAAEHTDVTLADYFAEQLGRAPRSRRRRRSSGRSRCWRTRSTAAASTTVGLRLAEPEDGRPTLAGRAQGAVAADSEMCSARARAAHSAGRRLHQPGAAEQHRGPEQVAEHRLVAGTAAPRRSTAQALPGRCGYMPLNAQTAKFDDRKEDQRAGHASTGERHRRAAPAPRQHAGEAPAA